ncbi:BREX protein BrxB domain-containing protein [uncultured Thiohalocapsa sp.]|uniref:BREX protein BrxB domain-containing protein n=1 Tax=uncultured Thiohalocapsa sp. TaxID=768990 RepID=UPI0025EFDBC3|nr:BREX protein BrxB domain-containing protein [uncultured Thiohalocapsa sp.]
MSSLKADFDELLVRIEAGRDFAHASFEPVFYLVFHPSAMLEAKRRLPAWEARLINDDWEVHRFSIAEAVADILDKQPAFIRAVWQTQDAKAPLAWDKTNKALAGALTKQDALQQRLEAQLLALEGHDNAILLVTDLEALHPYLRIGYLEGQLQGRFSVPTIIFYPGVRTGKTRLKFLGFYPEDGNYRSVHVGG